LFVVFNPNHAFPHNQLIYMDFHTIFRKKKQA
jgi:hypothetical protein